MKIKHFLPLLLGLFIFAGCATTKVDGAKELEGSWTVIGLEKDGVAQEIAISNLLIAKEGGKLTAGGCSGVNFFNGPIVAKDGKFKAGEFGLTRMMGEPAAMEFETLFISALANAESYKIENGVLTITAPAENLKIEFIREK